MRISRNYMSALMASNKSSASKRRMTNSLLSSNKNRYMNSLSNKTSAASTPAVYQNMKSNAASLQNTAFKLSDTGEDSIYAKAEESGDTTQITKSVKDFVNQYNSVIRNLKSGGSRIDNSYLNQLNSYASMHRNALKETGVTQNSDGTLSVNEKTLQKASVEQLRKTWGSESSFAGKAGTVAVNVQSNAISSMNSMINNSYSSLLRNFGASGGFFNFWS